MEALIQIVIWLVRAVYKAYRESQSGQAVDAADGSGGSRELLPGEAAGPVQVDPSLDEAVQSFQAELRAFTTSRGPGREQLVQAADAALSERVAEWETLLKVSPEEAQRRIPGELAEGRRALAALKKIAAQREGGGDRAAFLQRVDAVATALYSPLLEFQRRRGFALSTRYAAAFVGETSASLTAALARVEVAPIEVSVRLQHDAIAWPAIAREVARDILASLDGYEAELRRAAAFPGAQAVDLTAGYLTEEHVVRSQGAWLQPLAADAIATLLFGPAYLAHLVSLLRIPDQPFKVRVVQVASGFVSGTPPAELRVQISAAVLEQIGFADEANGLLVGWNDTHGADLEFYFPVGGGRYATLGEDFYVQPARALARAVCGEQVAALSGMHLVDVPDLHHSLGRQRQTEAVAQAFALGTPPRKDDPRAVITGAALLGQRDPEQRVAVLPLIQQSIEIEAPERQTRDPIAQRLEKETLLSPDVIRDAMVLPRVLQRKGLSFGR